MKKIRSIVVHIALVVTPALAHATDLLERSASNPFYSIACNIRAAMESHRKSGALAHTQSALSKTRRLRSELAALGMQNEMPPEVRYYIDPIVELESAKIAIGNSWVYSVDRQRIHVALTNVKDDLAELIRVMQSTESVAANPFALQEEIMGVISCLDPSTEGPEPTDTPSPTQTPY